MKVFTNGERHALLDTCAGVPRKPALPGWRGYTLVAFTRAPMEDEWRAESSERLGKTGGTLNRLSAVAHKLARRLGLAVPRTWDSFAINYSPNGDWCASQAWIADAAGRDAVLVSVFPDAVWGTHFPDVRGPLVAVVQWPPGANNDTALCRATAVCLGADAWAHLDAAAAAFRARVCADVGDAAVAVRATMSHTPLCIRGATVYLERVSLPREDETWSAELIRGREADDALTLAVFASKTK